MPDNYSGQRIHIVLSELAIVQVDALREHFALPSRNAAIVFAINALHATIATKGNKPK